MREALCKVLSSMWTVAFIGVVCLSEDCSSRIIYILYSPVIDSSISKTQTESAGRTPLIPSHLGDLLPIWGTLYFPNFNVNIKHLFLILSI